MATREVRRVSLPGWIDDTRKSYDTVAVSYADLLPDSLAGLLAWFSLIHVPDDEVPTVEAEMLHHPEPGIEGGFLFATRLL